MTKTLYKNRVAVMKRIIKEAGELPGIRRNRFFNGMFKYGDRYIVTDGVRLLMLDNEYDGIPLTGEYNELDIRRLFDEDEATKRASVTMDEVNDFIKSNVKKAFPLDYGIYCNARYLKDMLMVFPDAKIYVGKPTDPIQFVEENGEAGILMPIREKKED